MKTEIILFIIIIACIGIVGHLNARDIKACVDQGHTHEHCLRVFNP